MVDVKVVPIAEQFRELLELYPPVKSNKLLPEWYKKMSLSNSHDHLISQYHDSKIASEMGAKNCPAIQDILSEGFIVPMWSKFDFATTQVNNTIKQNYHLHFLDSPQFKDEKVENHLSYHTPSQLGDMDLKLSADKKLYKLFCPYYFILPEGYNIMYTDPFYHFRKNVRFLSGVVQADKWGSITFPFEIYNDNFSIEVGTPLVHCFVYKRDDTDVNINIDIGTEKDFSNIKKTFTKLISSRRDYRKHL